MSERSGHFPLGSSLLKSGSLIQQLKSQLRSNNTFLLHVTSVNAAVSILKSRIFNPFITNPHNGDSGLNSFELFREANFDQDFKEEGAVIVFEWSGPTTTVYEPSFPLTKNILYRFGAWRSFIPFQSNEFLQMIHIESSIGNFPSAVIKNLSSKPAIGIGVAPIARTFEGK